MRRLILTQAQIDEIKKKKDCSAMAQVGNKVNAGIMDGITAGGMFEEGAEPEANIYTIGPSKSDTSISPYYHVNESTDIVSFDGGRLTCYDSNAIPFISFIKKDGSKTKMFVGEYGEIHSTMLAALVSNGSIKKEDFGSLWDIKRDESRSGRVWIMDDCTVISFYSYGSGFGASPNNLRRIYDSCVEALNTVMENTGKDFSIGRTMVDWWTFDTHKNVIAPVRWFNNGVLELYAPYIESCVPVKTFNGEYEYKLKTTRGTFMLDWKGDKTDSVATHNSINESIGKDFNLEESMKSLMEFMSKKIQIKPYPEIHLNDDDQDGLFIRTGYYLPDKKSVTLFVTDRHPKDILRSLAHELIHHNQNLRDPNFDWGGGGNLEDDKTLRKLEAEAFLKGNLLFREWTESEKPRERKALNETITQSMFIYENIEKELAPDDVDLSSFNIKRELNPKFWKDGHLDSRIRLKLIDIADAVMDYIDADWFDPEDVTITGSLANYNWNDKYSDIDLHILIDFDDIDEDKEKAKKYVENAIKSWKSEHNGITIYGFPVEVYVQDANEPHTSSGVYSIDKDKWLVEPDYEKLKSGKVNKGKIRRMVSFYATKIDDLCGMYNETNNDEYRIRELGEKVEKVFKAMKNERKKGLSGSSSEINNGNIMYKALRRGGYLQKIIDLRHKVFDKQHSLLQEGKNGLTVYMMIGIPGAGKSTWIQNNHPELPVVSRDIIRVELGMCEPGQKYAGTNEEENEVTMHEYMRMGQYCSEGQDFIVDDTNTHKKYRKQMIDFLREKGAKIVFVHLDTPLDVCKERRKNDIPGDVMDRIHRRFQAPEEDEYDEIIHV